LGWQQLVKTSREQCQSSFGVEGNDRIEAHGAQCGNIAGGECDSGEDKSDDREGEEIRGGYAVEQAGHEVRDDERAQQAHTGTGSGQIDDRDRRRVFKVLVGEEASTQ